MPEPDSSSWPPGARLGWPTQSSVRLWSAHLDRAMTAERVPEDVRERVLQRVLYGSPVPPDAPAGGPLAARDVHNWLYDRAETAAAAGLPLEAALQAVRDGYSSVDADRRIALDP